ncbi:MAG: glycosyltransferase family 2 protein [Bdellovibrio sp.]
MIKLSVAIITFNEEDNILRCLESVAPIADEIVVVDSFSTDKTPEICKNFGVKFIQNPFKGHIEQKNFALDQCQYDYVLSLDADEALTSELCRSIMNVKAAWKGNGYSFNRLTNYAGHWVRHCGWYPDTKLRLIKKSEARWTGVNPHDILELHHGKEIHLPGDLLHYSYKSITAHVNQTNKFTTIAAKEAFNRGVTSSIFKIVTRSLLKFIRDYFWKRGFLDGYYGLIICTINSLSAFLKYSKIRELQRQKSIEA